MLVTLGARARTDDLVDLLAACHRRIRQHVVLARRLVEQGAERPLDEVRATAAQIVRYFTLAFPLHLADEDLTLAPALVGAGPEVTAMMATMRTDHAEHQPLVDRFVALCRAVERDPAMLPDVSARLATVTEELAAQLATHLELEERVMFPALRQLPADARAALLVEVRARRDGVYAPGDEQLR